MERFYRPSLLRSFGISFACSTAACAILGVQLFIADRSHNNVLPIFHYVIWPGLLCYTWAVITPFVLAFYRRYPITKSNWPRRLGQYVLATGCFLLAQAVLHGVAAHLYIRLNFVWWRVEAVYWMSIGQLIKEELIKDPILNLQICAFLYVLSAYWHAQEQIRNRQLREAQLEARVAFAELEMLRIQLHPHFLFNTLQAVSVLVHEDSDAAEDVLLRLSDLLRVALDEMTDHEVTLQQELDFLDLYIGIQRQRFKDRLRISVTADPAVLECRVPSLILQPLVENAVHHGIGRHKGNDSVEVAARASNGFLELEVCNYSGRLVESGRNNGNGSRQGVGLANIRARLEQLYGEAASLELRALSPCGVSAMVRISLTSEELAIQ